MTSYGSATRGDIETRDRLPALLNVSQAVSTTLIAGSIVYIDGANGVKVAPVDGSIPASRLYFCKEGQTSTAVLGEKKCTLYKCGHIVIGKCGGVITVSQVARQGLTAGNEGEFEAVAVPTNPGAVYAEAEADSNFAQLVHGLAIYLGHPSEGVETGNPPTDSVDADLGRFLLI